MNQEEIKAKIAKIEDFLETPSLPEATKTSLEKNLKKLKESLKGSEKKEEPKEIKVGSKRLRRIGDDEWIVYEVNREEAIIILDADKEVFGVDNEEQESVIENLDDLDSYDMYVVEFDPESILKKGSEKKEEPKKKKVIKKKEEKKEEKSSDQKIEDCKKALQDADYTVKKIKTEKGTKVVRTKRPERQIVVTKTESIMKTVTKDIPKEKKASKEFMNMVDGIAGKLKEMLVKLDKLAKAGDEENLKKIYDLLKGI